MKASSKIFIAGLAVVLLLVGCKTETVEVQTKTQVQSIELKDTSCIVDYAYPATICGLQDVAIFPQVSGRITAVKVIEGQYVNQGDVLFEIDDVPFKAAYQVALAQVEVAKAQLETAKLTLKSKKNLYERQIISEYQYNLAFNEVLTAKAVLGQAQASLKNAENDLSFTKVRTMGKGYIGTLPYKVGSLVGPTIQKPLTIVSDNSSVYADFSISQNSQLQLAGVDPSAYEKTDISLVTGIGQTHPYKGRIHSVSGLISAETGALPIRAIFPNPDKTLLSGGSCNVVFSIKEDNVIVVPRSAMKEIQNKLFVFVIKDGVLHQTEVNAERLDSKSWIIYPDSGNDIAPGDRITSTTNRLNDGQEVEIIG